MTFHYVNDHRFSLSVTILDAEIRQALVGVLSAIAQKERERSLKRAAEGRIEAKKRGQSLGRPPRLSQAQMEQLRRRHAAGELPATLAISYGVHKSTISRIVNQPWRYRNTNTALL